jgi:ATP-dependent protease HslVU (ClpYQ) peptidase subunit
MTTLIALQHDDWCLIAADSQTTGYDLSSDCSTMGKIAKNGQYLVSAAGLVRGMNLIQHSFVPPIAPKRNLDKFMINRFIPELRKTFIESGYEIKSDGDPASHDNDFIVAVNGTLYFIDEAYGLERINNKLYCAGSGQKLALGAAFALDAHKCDNYSDAITILYKAVKSAIEFDINSGGKVQIALQKKDGETFIELLDD